MIREGDSFLPDLMVDGSEGPLLFFAITDCLIFYSLTSMIEFFFS
jgi:hypothetical protein